MYQQYFNNTFLADKHLLAGRLKEILSLNEHTEVQKADDNKNCMKNLFSNSFISNKISNNKLLQHWQDQLEFKNN